MGRVLYGRVVAPGQAHDVGSARVGAAALACFAVLLLVLPFAARASGVRALEVFDAFYRAGALVFGGGHVVLPLLRAEVVPHGWLTDAQFLAGYAAAQAVPGPLFTFAGYLGAAMAPGPFAWLHGVWALGAIFLPAWLLVGGALPFWGRLRGAPGVQAALWGANAAVVGVLLAALYRPVTTEGVRGPLDAVVALLGFIALTRFRAPAWAVVAACAAYGTLGP
jgi:chromate transporter